MLPEPGDVVAAGLDMGLRADSSALVIVHKREPLIYVRAIIELRPTDGPLKPSHVIRTFAETMVRHRCSYAVGDSHYRGSVEEYLSEYDLSFAPGPTPPAEAYMRTRALMREGRIKMPNHKRLVQQLREVQGRPTSGGGMSIVHPRWATGGHGDLAAAFVLAVWQVSGDTVPAPMPATGTDAWVEAQKERRRQQLAERNEKRQRRFA